MTVVAPIHTILAFQTADGQRFHELVDAQKHTKRGLHAAVLTRAVKEDTRFAPLMEHAELIADFLMAFDKQISDVAADKMAPIALPEATVRQHGKVYNDLIIPMGVAKMVMPKVAQIKPDSIKSEVEAFEAEIDQAAFEDEMKHAQHSG